MQRLVRFALFSLLAAAALAQTPSYQAPAGVVVTHAYDRETVVRTPAGPATVRVEVRSWGLGGGTRIDRLPLPPEATVVAQLRGGELTTIIDGQRQERREGEFFTVPPGKALGLETEDDSAILKTIAILPPRG